MYFCCFPLFFSFLLFRVLVFDQSPPVHPVSESRGGTVSVKHGGGVRAEILLPNIGYWYKMIATLFITCELVIGIVGFGERGINDVFNTKCETCR